MISNPELYAPGTSGFQRMADKYGNDGAMRIYRAALTLVDGAVTDAINRENGGQETFDRWGALWEQFYNDPFGAPLEQLGTVATNTINAAGDAAKKAAASATKNWGAWLIGAIIIGAAFFYFGGAAVVRRKLSKA